MSKVAVAGMKNDKKKKKKKKKKKGGKLWIIQGAELEHHKKQG